MRYRHNVRIFTDVLTRKLIEWNAGTERNAKSNYIDFYNSVKFLLVSFYRSIPVQVQITIKCVELTVN